MRVDLLGIPFDGGSSYLRGSALAPKAIRDSLWPEWGNSYCEVGLDLKERLHVLGDLELDIGRELESIEEKIFDSLHLKSKLIMLGGDHSITYPILRAYKRSGCSFDVLQIDAHPDLYDSFQGTRYSHASPFARIMEESLASSLTQVGIRTLNLHQREQSLRYGVRTIEMMEWSPMTEIHFKNPVYVSIDLDALDPAFAPGVSHPEPGGFTVREVISIIQKINVPIVGADVVELNPTVDTSNATALVAAKIVKELAGAMLSK
ncbi:MAG: agmatinase [Pirellula sp.]|nr:agmatinase [Pirellula sp.]